MKTAKTISWILIALLAIGFFGAGLTKLLGVEMQVQNFKSWGYPAWMIYPVGLSEVAIAAALLFFKPKLYVVYGIYPWALVAIATHLQAGQASMIGGPVVFAILNTLLLFTLKKVEQRSASLT